MAIRHSIKSTDDIFGAWDDAYCKSRCMRVAELAALLGMFPQDALVVWTWEGVIRPCERDNFALSGDAKVVMVDVE